MLKKHAMALKTLFWLLPWAAAGIGCEAAPRASVAWVRSATITLSSEELLYVESAVGLVVEGQGRTNNLVLQLNATLTASSATTAARLAAQTEPFIERKDGAVRIVVPSVDGATVEGTLLLRCPDDLSLRAFGKGGTVEVRGLDGALEIDAVTHVRVEDARANSTVRVVRGNVLIQTLATPASETVATTQGGDIQLTLPRALSAQIQAQAQNGAISVQHPSLPRWLGGDRPYTANVGGGLALIYANTSAGNIILTQP